MNTSWCCFQELGVAIFCVIALSTNYANAEITPDATLPNNSRVTPQGDTRIIEGGTYKGSNLFHSFEEFSVPTGVSAKFKNAADTQNIITRITGKSTSNIDGMLSANGTANLFLINPNGIIFGPNASLKIGGSFISSTASSVNFADGIKFSATEPQTKTLLTINVPIGLQFGTAAAPIHNQSQASPDGATNIFGNPAGLQVNTGKTLALLGGDITLKGGNLTASEGRIELGSVAENSLVSLNPTNQNWILGYEGVQEFKNVQLIQQNINGSLVSSVTDASGKGGGNIKVQGNSVELIGGGVRLRTATIGTEDAGDLQITARNLILRDGAQIGTFSFGKGKGGNLIINTSESVRLIGSFIEPTGDESPSALLSATAATGEAGNITINTTKLLIKEGAGVSPSVTGIINDSFFIPATGKGGNLIVNASELVELTGKSAGDTSSSLIAFTLGSGNAGNLAIATKKFNC